jgi:hypothetical protein
MSIPGLRTLSDSCLNAIMNKWTGIMNPIAFTLTGSKWTGLNPRNKNDL